MELRETEVFAYNFEKDRERERERQRERERERERRDTHTQRNLPTVISRQVFVEQLLIQRVSGAEGP